MDKSQRHYAFVNKAACKSLVIPFHLEKSKTVWLLGQRVVVVDRLQRDEINFSVLETFADSGDFMIVYICQNS